VAAGRQHILLVDNERINNRFREGYNKLRVIDLATGRAPSTRWRRPPRQISERDEGAAVLSPDGTKVAFIMDSLLHVMPVNPTARRPARRDPVSSEPADLPSWGGDSRHPVQVGQKLKHGHRPTAAPARRPGRTCSGAGGARAADPDPRRRAVGRRSDDLRYDVDILVTGNRITWIRPHRAGSEMARTLHRRQRPDRDAGPDRDPHPPADAVPGRAVRGRWPR
jgi:hypothetical protein